MKNSIKFIDICQANYTYAKEVGGVEGEKILNRLDRLGFLGNNDIASNEFVGGTLIAYNVLRNREQSFNLIQRKSPI